MPEAWEPKFVFDPELVRPVEEPQPAGGKAPKDVAPKRNPIAALIGMSRRAKRQRGAAAAAADK
eukprot:gene39595-29246_t